MAFTLNRRLSTLVDSSGQLKTGKIPNDYINGDHIADNVITTAMLHTGFTLPISSLTSIDTDDVTEGSTNLFYTTARVDSHLSGGTGVTYSSGAISIGQAVATTDSPTFADLTITGNLNITGDINSYNVTDLDVTDQTITLGSGQIEANSGGSGIIIDGASASILWDETNDQFDFDKGINVDSNTLVVDGTNNRVGILQASPAVSLDVGSATDAFFVPKGTTAQRPTGVDGYFRYNTDDAQFEGYADGEWGAIAGSGGASAMETNNFTGDGSTTAFTLSSSVSSEDNLIVFIEGIYQNKGDYVASGTTITFDTAPVNGRRIVVQHIKSSVAGNSTLYTSLTGDGSTTAFTLSGAPGHENNTQVFMDGVYQQKDSYIVNGTTLTFDAAPANNAEIEVMSFAQTTINQPGTNTVSVAELNLSDGTAGQAIVTDGNGTISFASVGVSGIDSSADATAITIDSSERVGIGEISPDESLVVNGGVKIKSTNKLSFSNTSDQTYIHAVGSNLLAFGTDSTERMRIDTSGRVGINRTPSIANSKLEVGGADNVPLINVEASGVTGGMGIGSTGLQFFHGSTARMRIDSSGNVGIGANNPGSFFADSYLVVGDGTGTPTATIYGSSSGGSYLLFADGTSGAASYAGGIEYNHSSDFLAFFANGGSAMRIDSNGNLLLGTNTYSTGAFGSAFGMNISATRPQVVLKNETYNTDAYFGLADNLWVGTQDDMSLILATNDSQSMRITSNGAIIAGVDVDISSASAPSNTTFYSTNGDITVQADNGAHYISDLLPGYNRGQFGCMAANGSYMYFAVNGYYAAYLTSSGTLSASDERLKENVTTLTGSLDKINQLRGVSFNWKNEARGTGNNIGFIAQEVESVYPELVGDGGLPDVDGESPHKHVNYEKLVPALVEAIKELSTKLESAEARIETLENA